MSTPSSPLFARTRDPQGAPAAGSLVMLHGYGAHEEDLISLGELLDPRLRSIGLRAPLPLPWGGFAWYSLVPRGSGIDFNDDELDAAVAQVIETVEAIAKADGKPPVLLGFSQGGAVALSLALRRPELCRAVFALSPAPPRIAKGQGAPREKIKALPIFAAHGTQDQVIPILLGRQTRAFLEEAGCSLAWREYPMGHEISNQELSDARAFLTKVG